MMGSRNIAPGICRFLGLQLRPKEHLAVAREMDDILPLGKRWARKYPFGLTRSGGRCIIFTGTFACLPASLLAPLLDEDKSCTTDQI